MKTPTAFYSLLMAGALGLSLVATPLLAQPGNSQGQPGNSQGKGQGGGSWKGQGQQHPGQKGQGNHQARDSDERDRYEDRDRMRDGSRERDRYYDEASRPLIDEREIREIFRSRREVISHDDRDSLPPGIRMNLERGKPLPPGIAKKFDDRVRRDLPYYQGYEWRRVGTDAVLVDLTNDVIREVIHDILR
ncbi:anti-virulence regulator CigR family protein [Halomonas daqiaonensis]|uniref:Nickel/cobalt transporter regulator n=1 Tax=Halomonas daqiaonensis TaxID=650850 RepID=A0A1H7G084_9GAMM|nr:anti-virulence regulator CigR family protein [Halomonas daqiaonensis]SEK31541.1 Nickel/cobalt transporter regulator [Halomonas daqiaonensis]